MLTAKHRYGAEIKKIITLQSGGKCPPSGPQNTKIKDAFYAKQTMDEINIRMVIKTPLSTILIQKLDISILPILS